VWRASAWDLPATAGVEAVAVLFLQWSRGIRWDRGEFCPSRERDDAAGYKNLVAFLTVNVRCDHRLLTARAIRSGIAGDRVSLA